MKTIKNTASLVKVIQRSKFIAIGYNIQSLDEIKTYLDLVRQEYPGASHYCYGARINEDIFAYSDDGEPSYTAGIKIYQAINSRNLFNTLIIVVRYFGGIKLGVGPLSKAYQDLSFDLINEATTNCYFGKDYEIEFDYSSIKIVEQYIKNNNMIIIDKKYEQVIKFIIFVPVNCSLNSLQNYLLNIKIRKDNTYYYERN